ncbi:MAG TPA: cysteine--1-D-myo-inosityl 2-amino-2-deoxy-alpha-D-glucopyranoside ligase [Mycobacteriales bacterium]|nr:cysteine--1-D-myo-inosityl 2-amino-2-deoxy-alpha-D-glucopyranoside ligase [Mycobacteriales bacterium]
MQSWAAPVLPRLAPAGPDRPWPRVYDSASATLVPVARGRPALLYVCGITPYDAAHLGHAATYVAFDTLQRVWRDAGLDVRYVQNVTDVDDPLLVRAARTGEDWTALAGREIDRFRSDMSALRLLPPDVYPGVVESIDLVVGFIATLLERGAGYELDGDIYFPVAAATRFGGVAHLDRTTMLGLSAERGGDPDRPGKKDPLDALLWQAARPGEPAWESPFGPGRPGWHIECAAMALAHLGPTIDVQGGGSDLRFPHHELSAAEGTVASGVFPFARAFVHAGMVGLAGEKMSKSRGNLVFVSRLRAEGADPTAIRLALLAHHYREDWDWTHAQLDAAAGRLERWRSALGRPDGPPAAAVRHEVRVALAEDLDSPAAIAAVDAWVAACLAGTGSAEPGEPQAVADLVDALLGV